MKTILYHNHNCSKSRTCHELLKKKKVEFELRNYIKFQLTSDEVKEIVYNLNRNIDELIR